MFYNIHRTFVVTQNKICKGHANCRRRLSSLRGLRRDWNQYFKINNVETPFKEALNLWSLTFNIFLIQGLWFKTDRISAYTTFWSVPHNRHKNKTTWWKQQNAVIHVKIRILIAATHTRLTFKYVTDKWYIQCHSCWVCAVTYHCTEVIICLFSHFFALYIICFCLYSVMHFVTLLRKLIYKNKSHYYYIIIITWWF